MMPTMDTRGKLSIYNEVGLLGSGGDGAIPLLGQSD